jgi:hypothetical protein
MTTTVALIKKLGMEWVETMMKDKTTLTKPGSISFLLFGQKPSDQSINIKCGRLGEYITKELVKATPGFELLLCGVQDISGKNKDIDLVFKNFETNILYYRELKANIELDTEKVQATIAKCKEIETSLKNRHPGYIVNTGILNWSVYNRSILKSGLSHIKTFEKDGIKIDHMEDFFAIIGLDWPEQDYYLYFREIGDKIKECSC